MAGRFTVDTIFKVTDKVTGPINRLKKNAKGFGKTTQKSFKKADKSAKKFGGTLKGLKGAFAAAGLTMGLLVVGNAIKDLIVTGMEFEQTMVNAAVKFPGNIEKGTEKFRELETVAKDIGAKTEFSAKQAAAGLDFLAMAGFDAEQSMKTLPGIVDLATAANVDLATAADISSDTLGAFGLMTKDTTQLVANLSRVSDVMAKTATSANTNMELMFETFKTAGPIATAVGADIEQVSALTAVLANAGIKGSDAGTTLKNVFLRLAAPVGKARTALNKLGVQTQDSGGNFRKVTDILKDMQEKLKFKGTAEQAKYINAIFGKIPVAGAANLLTSLEAVDEFEEKFRAAAGTTEKMATKMRATTEGAFKGMNSAIEGVKLELFETFKDALTGLMLGVTNLARGMIEFLKKHKGKFEVFFSVLSFTIGGVIAVIGDIIDTIFWFNDVMGGIPKFLLLAYLGFKGLIVVIGILKGVWALLNVIMAANPFMLIVIGISAVVLAVLTLIKHWDKVVAKLKAGWKWIKGVFGVEGAEEVEKKRAERARAGAEAASEMIGYSPFAETDREAIAAGRGGETEKIQTNKATVDVNINNAPRGTSIKQKGNVPGLTVALGPAGA